MFAFFLESAFLGALVLGERRLGPAEAFPRRARRRASAAGCPATSSSCTNAFMQHPVGHAVAADGTLRHRRLRRLSAEPVGARRSSRTTRRRRSSPASFVVAAVGAFYTLRGQHLEQARLYLRTATIAGLVAAVLVAFPTGDLQAKMVARHQEPALAAMEGRFESGPMAEITLIGQPNVQRAPARQPDQDSRACSASSPSARSTATCAASTRSRRTTGPTNIELLYYAFHVMAGLGTLFIALMAAGQPAALARTARDEPRRCSGC